jgi:hypothetical protein
MNLKLEFMHRSDETAAHPPFLKKVTGTKPAECRDILHILKTDGMREETVQAVVKPSGSRERD